MCVWVVARLHQRLKSTFFEIFSSLCRHLRSKQFQNKIDFSRWGKQYDVPKLQFLEDFRALCSRVIMQYACVQITRPLDFESAIFFDLPDMEAAKFLNVLSTFIRSLTILSTYPIATFGLKYEKKCNLWNFCSLCMCLTG